MRVPNPWKGIGAQPREIWALCAATLVNRVGTMIVPFLVLYLTESRHFSESAAGGVLALYGFGSLIASPISGSLSDRLGPLRVMIAALALAGTIALTFPFLPGFAPVVAAAFAYALVGELVRPASLTIVSTYSDPERRKAAFALNRMVINLGMSIGPALGGFLSAVSFPLLFWVDGATSIAGAAVLFLATRSARRRAPLASGGTRATGVSARGLRDRRLLHALLAIVPVGIVFFQFESALPLYLVRQ
ncbi:MAG TPA: MFS transporter, partial [bacterium]|nr:MFS transporter [bacterium]